MNVLNVNSDMTGTMDNADKEPKTVGNKTGQEASIKKLERFSPDTVTNASRKAIL